MILAHGGTGGAVVETMLVLGVLFIFGAVWIRERRMRDSDEEIGDGAQADELLFRDEEASDERD